MTRQAEFFTELAQQRVQCSLCPHNCLIAPGGQGRCRVRVNQEGKLTLPFHGLLSSLAVDPIEKKPLYHFYPGAVILSAGFWGCNFRCPFCQNFEISQNTASNSAYLSPQDLVAKALACASVGIAYTYSEPLVHIEYLLDTAALAREAGLKNVLVTNGFINPQPAETLLRFMDAANIDLKAFREDFYRDEIKGGLAPVKEFIAQAVQRIHIEVTTLVIPGKNDTDQEIADAAAFLSALNPLIPYHLSCYFPRYKYSLGPTPATTVAALAAIARQSLAFVYVGNSGNWDNNTYCPRCADLLVERSGYLVKTRNLKGNHCGVCGADLNLIA